MLHKEIKQLDVFDDDEIDCRVVSGKQGEGTALERQE